MNIIRFNINHLHNEQLYQFGSEVKKLGDEVGLSEVEVIKAVYAAFVLLFDQLGTGLEQVRKSEHTARLHEADRLRDSLYHGLTMLVEAYGYSPVPAKAEAAQSIRIVMDTYGDFRKSDYAEETASITNFLDTLAKRCAGQMELIGAGEWTVALDKANRDFDILMGMRFDEQANQEQVNIRQTRREMEDAYGKLVYLVEALGQLHPEMQPRIDPFIGRLNERIAYYRNLIAQRRGRNRKKAEDAAQNILL